MLPNMFFLAKLLSSLPFELPLTNKSLDRSGCQNLPSVSHLYSQRQISTAVPTITGRWRCLLITHSVQYTGHKTLETFHFEMDNLNKTKLNIVSFI